MTTLLTVDDFTPYRAISANINVIKKLLPYVGEAQQFDLKELMGSAFYLSFINDYASSPSFANYTDLWNGSEWIVDNKTYRHEGLKVVLIYLSYARYVMNSNIEETAHGTVIKKEEYSTPVSEKTILRKADSAKSGAIVYFDDVKKYLDDNYTLYPLWDKCCDKKVLRSSVSAVEPLDQRTIKDRRRRR